MTLFSWFFSRQKVKHPYNKIDNRNDQYLADIEEQNIRGCFPRKTPSKPKMNSGMWPLAKVRPELLKYQQAVQVKTGSVKTKAITFTEKMRKY